MKYKEALLDLHAKADELARAAAGLQNKNLADIVASAAGKLSQASEHADCEAVDALHAEAPPPFHDPAAGDVLTNPTGDKPPPFVPPAQ